MVLRAMTIVKGGKQGINPLNLSCWDQDPWMIPEPTTLDLYGLLYASNGVVGSMVRLSVH